MEMSENWDDVDAKLKDEAARASPTLESSLRRPLRNRKSPCSRLNLLSPRRRTSLDDDDDLALTIRKNSSEGKPRVRQRRSSSSTGTHAVALHRLKPSTSRAPRILRVSPTSLTGLNSTTCNSRPQQLAMQDRPLRPQFAIVWSMLRALR